MKAAEAAEAAHVAVAEKLTAEYRWQNCHRSRCKWRDSLSRHRTPVGMRATAQS